jgi:hypothetical protein
MADDFNWQTGQAHEESAVPDIVLPGGVSDNKSGEDLDRETQRREIPVGDQLLFVRDIEVEMDDYTHQPKEQQFKVWLDGKPNTYYGYNLTVTAAWTEDPEATIKVFLRTPPVNPAELRAYSEGGLWPDAGENAINYTPPKWSIGRDWRYFKHFIHHLGFEMNPDGTIPREAQLPGNWRRWPDGQRRVFVAKILPGKNPKDDPRNTAGKKIFNQLDFYPFRDSEDTIRRRAAMRNGQGYTQTQTQLRQPQTQPQSQKPQTRPQPATQARGGSGVSGGIAESDIPEI